MRLPNRVAIITGAASGVGRASCLIFAREGASIAAVDVNREGGEETSALVRAAGGQAVFIQASVDSKAEAQRAVRETAARFGAVHILFNNAGIPGSVQGTALDGLTEEDWQQVMNINLKGVMLFAQAALPEIKKAGGGAIVNTSSLAGVIGMGRGNQAYSAAKAGIVGLTKAWALQYAKDNIRVNAIAPGYIDTPLGRGVRSGLNEAQQEKYMTRVMTNIPIGRFAGPEDIANAALYLASDQAAFVTGHVLVVDGGYSSQ
ncbi:MAG: SDR family oxidoreductase [Chloroflexi bacterium]|nr:SDR family oxidoreductase [Chloroflexota bacterium]